MVSQTTHFLSFTKQTSQGPLHLSHSIIAILISALATISFFSSARLTFFVFTICFDMMFFFVLTAPLVEI